MKKYIYIISLLCVLLLLCACTAPAPNADNDPTDQPSPPAPDTSDPGQGQSDTRQHSPLYLPGFEVDEILLYFNEVCLDAEINNSGDPSRLQKWTTPIYYQLYGDYTAEDLTVLTGFANWLNTVEGFPGIYEAQNGQQSNLRIHFCPRQEMASLMGDWATGLDGAVTFWYNSDEIYDATICYRTDVDQQVRSSVILEEIYNGLGPVQDTDKRSDSIIYSGYSTPQSLTAMDELLLRLLYHPQLTCGMDLTQCEAVIRQLYY